jgi:hypothetical protein
LHEQTVVEFCAQEDLRDRGGNHWQQKLDKEERRPCRPQPRFGVRHASQVTRQRIRPHQADDQQRTDGLEKKEVIRGGAAKYTAYGHKASEVQIHHSERLHEARGGLRYRGLRSRLVRDGHELRQHLAREHEVEQFDLPDPIQVRCVACPLCNETLVGCRFGCWLVAFLFASEAVATRVGGTDRGATDKQRRDT